MTAAGERRDASPATGQVVVLPRRSRAWRAGDQFVFLALVALVCIVAVGTDEWFWPLVALVFLVLGWLFCWWFARRDVDRVRLRIDDLGIAEARRDGTPVTSIPWERVSKVRFESGRRIPSISGMQELLDELPVVRWADDGPHRRWSEGWAHVVVVPAVGCSAAEDLERTLRAACDAHGIPFEADWSWGWRLRRRTVNRRNRSN